MKWTYKAWIKSNGNSSIFLTWLYSQEYNIYVPSVYCPRPRIYHLLPNVWKASYTISASIFVDVPYWPPYSRDKVISCVVPGPSQWLFLFGKEIVIAWTNMGWVRWMFQNLPLPATQGVHDSSISVTSCICMKNDGVLYHHMLWCDNTALPHVSHSPWKHPCAL